MYPPDQLRTWANELRAAAPDCTDADHTAECLLQAGRMEELAVSVEQFMQALARTGTTPVWRVKN